MRPNPEETRHLLYIQKCTVWCEVHAGGIIAPYFNGKRYRIVDNMHRSGQDVEQVRAAAATINIWFVISRNEPFNVAFHVRAIWQHSGRLREITGLYW